MRVADPPVTHVLVVDDTEGNRYVTSRLLRASGYQVSEAGDGTTALQIASAEHPDLIVLDINLPDMDGFTVVERLRAMPEGVSTPVLHLSASYTTNADKARGLERGADSYLTHPIDPVVFIATVRALLRASSADKRLRDAAREWEATFNALSDAVMLLDEQGIVRRCNRVACALFGEDDIVDMNFGELLEKRFPGATGSLAERFLEGQEMDKELFEIGERFYQVTVEQVHDAAPRAGAVCVMEDVTERLEDERERLELLALAQNAQRDAEAANKAKNEFLAVMSHELRTPLNAIGGYAQLIELGIRGPITEAQRADIERIKRSQTYLLSLINDVLNFAKIEAGHLQVNLTDVSLGEMVNGMRDFVEPQLTERKLRFTTDVCDDGVTVSADPEKVQQILINLLSNALKFTPAGGAIALSCRTTDGLVSVSVHDTGSGIAPDKLDTIFEPFVQVDRRYKREQEGIGLGLAISRELARAMGGDLTVRSVEEQGSEFVLTLRRSEH